MSDVSTTNRAVGSLEVSLVGLGTNNFGMRCDEAQTARVIHAALDLGVTFFDTAESYGMTQSESFIGAALAGGRRDEAVIATKFGNPMAGVQGNDPAYVKEACEASLARLGTDRIDLYQYHHPDPSVPYADTIGAMCDLIDEGKVLEIGVCNLEGDAIDEVEQAARDRGHHVVTMQNHYSLLERAVEETVLPWCARYGMGVLPYFPLASGLLTGKYTRGETPPEGTRFATFPPQMVERFSSDANWDAAERLQVWAADHGHSLLELAMAWLASQPTTASVIAGATSPEQVEANAAAVRWTLTPDQIDEARQVAAGNG